MIILVLGVSGMLGNAAFRYFDSQERITVFGSARAANFGARFGADAASRIFSGVSVENDGSVIDLLDQTRPDVVFNCIGIVKQRADVNDPPTAFALNAYFPHRLARMCSQRRARLVHISTDCVFSGAKGNYIETDTPDAQDMYGRSKMQGELDYPDAVTLRTSVIGHELESAHGLIDWFLSQKSPIKGFTRAIFSGLPTFELARVVHQHVIPYPELHGVYHVSCSPISKFDLLRLVANAYGHHIEIAPDETLSIDRSLNSGRFRRVTGYNPASWPELVNLMKRTR